MSAPVVVFGIAWTFLAAFTVALVLSRASRERDVRRQVARDIRDHAAQVSRFPAASQFTSGLLTAARIAEGLQSTPGFVTADSSGNVRRAGDWRRSS